MKLIPCAPPRGPLTAAPLTELVTPTMRRLEAWHAYWGEDDAYYARLDAAQEDESPRWFRVGLESATPIFGMPAVAAPPAEGAPVEAVAPELAEGAAPDALDLHAHARLAVRDALHPARGVVLYARLTRASGRTRITWMVGSRGDRRGPARAPVARDMH